MKELEQDIKNHAFHPVYLLYGEEAYLIKEYRNQLKKALLEDGEEMNYSYVSGKHLDFAEIRDSGSTLPFFSEYRLLLFEETGLFHSSNEMADVLKEFPESTIVVFVEKEVDKRNKLYKYVKQHGVVVEIGAMNEKEIKRFIAEKLSQSGKKIRESTALYFLEQVDSSLFSLVNELEKLIAYTAGREEVTKEDIDAICCVQAEGKMFRMLDAVANGEKKKMIHFYRELLAVRESPIVILRLLVRHCNILLQVKMEEERYPKQELAKKIGVAPFFLGTYLGQAKRFSTERLKEMLTSCTQMEYDLKRGKISDQIGVEMLLLAFTEQQISYLFISYEV